MKVYITVTVDKDNKSHMESANVQISGTDKAVRRAAETLGNLVEAMTSDMAWSVSAPEPVFPALP